jgi:glycosyltransferase involved in cell wall biosynthesis
MKVSVVLPSYNHARFLSHCLEGVFNQTYDDWELLFLDDVSQDDSVEIARSYDDPRIKILPNAQNLGTYATENRGIELASGDLIAILNSDDAWRPEKLEKQVALLQKHPDATFCYTLGEIIDEESKPWAEQNHHRDYPTTERHALLPYLFNVNQVLASSLVFRKGAVRFEENLRYCGDWVAALRLAQPSDALFVNEVLTEWRQHPDNSSKLLPKTIGEEVSVRSEILRQFSDQGGPKLLRCALDLAAHQILLGQSRAARATLDSAKNWITPEFARTWSRRRLATFLPTNVACRWLWPDQDPYRFRKIVNPPVKLR